MHMHRTVDAVAESLAAEPLARQLVAARSNA